MNPSDEDYSSSSYPTDQKSKKPRKALLGAEGQEYILTKLSSGDPKTAITSFQKQFSSLSSDAVVDSIPPILELTDLLNVNRNNLFFGLMNHLKKILLDKIENENEQIDDQDTLLEQTFPYIGFEELRPIVYSLLKRMPKIPVKFLQQLQANNEIFKNLPIEVKRQVWVNDENLFIKHISTLLKKYDTPQIYKADLLSVHKVDPKKKREKNQTLISMINILGKNIVLYHRVLSYCRDQLLATGSRHFCTFRYDLLMALHDNQVQQLHQMDMCHYFCWWLDAWVRTVHAHLLTFANTEHTEDVRSVLTYTKNPSAQSNNGGGSSGKNVKKTKKGAKAKTKVKKEEASSSDSMQNTDSIRTDSKQQIVLSGVESGDTLTLKDFFDLRRMKELGHFFEKYSDSEVWGDVAVICRSPYISNTLLQQIFYLLEFIYSQNPNMPNEPLDKVLQILPVKQKNKRGATEHEDATLRKKNKNKQTKPEVNTNTKGTTIKISFKGSEPSPPTSSPTPVPTAPVSTSSVPVATHSYSSASRSLPPYIHFLDDAHNVNDFAEYIESLTRLYNAGESAQAMLKHKIPFQLPPMPEYLAYEFYPFIQRMLFSTIGEETVSLDMASFQEQNKKNGLARNLLLFCLLRFHQNSRIASLNLHRTISSYEDLEALKSSQTEQKKRDDDVEKFRNVDVPHDALVYEENLNKLRFAFKALLLEENGELNPFGKSALQEFNFVDSLIADCSRLVKDIQQHAIPILLSGNIKWFFTHQLSELVETYTLLVQKFVIPYIIFNKQDSLAFQISVGTFLKEVASASHLLGSILLTIKKEVFELKEKKDENDMEDEENKKFIHDFDEYKDRITDLKNLCQNLLQEVKNVAISDSQLTKIFQAAETQLVKEWKALQTESKSLLLLHQEQEEKARKEKAVPSTPSAFPSTPGKFVSPGMSPSPFGKPIFAQGFASSLSPSQVPKFAQSPFAQSPPQKTEVKEEGKVQEESKTEDN